MGVWREPGRRHRRRVLPRSRPHRRFRRQKYADHGLRAGLRVSSQHGIEHRSMLVERRIF